MALNSSIWEAGTPVIVVGDKQNIRVVDIPIYCKTSGFSVPNNKYNYWNYSENMIGHVGFSIEYNFRPDIWFRGNIEPNKDMSEHCHTIKAVAKEKFDEFMKK